MTVVAPDTLPTGTDEDEDHIVCRLTEDWSVCGRDVSDAEWGDGTGENMCDACLDFLDEDFCAHCAMEDT